MSSGVDVDVDLGHVGHVAFVVDDVSSTMAVFAALGTCWSSVSKPTARLQMPTGEIVEVEVDYVASSRGEPRVKLLSTAPGTLFSRGFGSPIHHISYWVEDLERTTERLVAIGWVVEATGLDESSCPRYRYLRSTDGRRVELGLTSERGVFDAWAEETERAEEISPPG